MEIQWYYSATTKGFYNSDVNGTNIPEDAVEITVDQHTALMAAQAEGHVIQADDSGVPQSVAPSSAQIAAVAGLTLIKNGIAITSTAFPNLNGTYPLSQNALFNMTGMMAYIMAKNAFPGGAGSLTWYDESGVGHSFTTVAEFEVFAEAVCEFVTQVQEYIDSGGTSGSLPSNAVNIA